MRLEQLKRMLQAYCTTMHFTYLLAAFLLFLSGCVDSGYHPSYIISDKSHEEIANSEEGSR